MTTRNLLWLAALSFVPTLFFYMVGEEGIYTISTLEMWHNKDWFTQTMFGHNLQRPPLFNWLAIPLAQVLGWSHILLVIRLMSVAATLGMAAWLYWLVKRLYQDKDFALFAALGCLSLADLLLYRGWLSYTDPLFGFFIFGAIANAWVACVEQQRRWLAWSVWWIGCALLTKVFTAYVFYATALFVLLWFRPYRQFLLSPVSLLILAGAAIVPYAWFSHVPQVSGQSGSMLNEILGKLRAGEGWAYLQHLLNYLVEAVLWLAPAPLLAMYLWARRRVVLLDNTPQHFRAAVWITGLAILPYWIAPQGGIRYLLPVYPLIALVCARVIWRAGSSGQRLALRWFAGLIAFKFIFALALFPYYQSHYRGENYVLAAHALHQKTLGYPLYVDDSSSIGENIVGQIDIDRLPAAPLQRPPAQWDNGFLLTYRSSDPGSTLLEKLSVAKDELYLFCRGAACSVGNVPKK